MPTSIPRMLALAALGAAALACPLSFAAAESGTPAPLSGMYARLEQLRGSVNASATAAVDAKAATHAPASVAHALAQRIASTTARASTLSVADFAALRERFLASTSAPHVAAILRDDAIATSTRLAILEYASTTRARIEDRLQAFEAGSAARIEKRQDRLDQLKQKVNAHVYDAIQHAVMRLADASGRLGDLLKTISDRAAEAAADGTDVTAADTAITAAEASLQGAQAAIDDAQAAIGTAATSTVPARHMQSIRTAVTAAVTALKAAHQDIIAAMQAVNAADAPASVSASATTTSGD